MSSEYFLLIFFPSFIIVFGMGVFSILKAIFFMQMADAEDPGLLFFLAGLTQPPGWDGETTFKEKSLALFICMLTSKLPDDEKMIRSLKSARYWFRIFIPLLFVTVISLAAIGFAFVTD